MESQVAVASGDACRQPVRLIPAKLDTSNSMSFQSQERRPKLLDQVRKPAHVTPFFCDALTGRWLRHAHDSRTTWTSRDKDHHGLPPRAEPWG